MQKHFQPWEQHEDGDVGLSVQTEISQQLLLGLPGNFVRTLIIHRGFILLMFSL